MNIKIVRSEYTNDTTIGSLFINDERFCYTLEDTVRARGIKVKGHTAIPAGTYHVNVTMSGRFKRMMPIVYSEADGMTLSNEGVSFVGIRLHGGNTHQNTEGCPLVAYNRPSKEMIQGTAEKELTQKIKAAIDSGEQVFLIIENKPQNG